MIFRLHIFLYLIQISKQGALQKKRPSELSAFKKKGILHDTVSSWQHFPPLGAYNPPWKYEQQGEKSFLEKLRKYTQNIYVYQRVS